MDYTDIVGRISPCGSDCHRCTHYANGEIKELSSRLLALLGDYAKVAEIKAHHDRIFEDYPQFHSLLNHFAGATCGGCRTDDVRCPIDCEVKDCYKEKGVDFCFQCTEYPCNRRSSSVWRMHNDHMNKMGVVEFFNIVSRRSNY